MGRRGGATTQRDFKSSLSNEPGRATPAPIKKRINNQSKNPLTLTANSQKTATNEMKLFKMTFAALGVIAAIAIAMGAYWHIFTLGACWLMVWAANHTEY